MPQSPEQPEQQSPGPTAQMSEPVTAVSQNHRRSSTDDPDDLTAIIALPLVLNWRFWVHRRVECIEMIDEARIRRVTTIEFTLPNPKHLTGKLFPHSLIYVPVATLPGRLRQAFRLNDETGRLLPVATRSHTEKLELRMIKCLAEGLLTTMSQGQRTVDLYSSLCDNLETIVKSESRAEIVKAWDQIVADRQGPVPQGWPLSREPEFKTLTLNLALQYILFAQLRLDECVDIRRIVELHEEVEPKGHYRGLRERILPEQTIKFQLSQATVCESYHCEIHLPPELSIRSRNTEPKGLTVEARRHYAILWQRNRGSEPKMPVLVVKVALDTNSLIGSAFWAAVGTTLVIASGLALRLLLKLHPAPSVTGAVIAVLPAIFATFLLRTGEHPMVAEFSESIKVCMLVTAAISYALAVTLAVSSLPSSWSFPFIGQAVSYRSLLWFGFGLVETGIAIFLGLQWHFSAKRPESADRTEPTSVASSDSTSLFPPSP